MYIMEVTIFAAILLQALLGSILSKGGNRYPLLKGSKMIEKLVSRSANSFHPRIAYGKPAPITSHPYFASLSNCGAAILSERWVITAAHCVEDGVDHQLWVGGDSYRNSKKVSFDKVVIHPYYVEVYSAILNDIALLRLTKPLTFSDKIQPIDLPDIDNSNEYVNRKSRYNSCEEDENLSENNSEDSKNVDCAWGIEQNFKERGQVDKHSSVENNDHSSESESHSDESDEHHSDKHDEENVSSENIYSQEIHVIVGRGEDENGEPTNNLMSLELIRVPASDCYAYEYPLLHRVEPYITPLLEILDEFVLCGVRMDDLPAAGFGDSGGPFVANNTLVGITSYGITSDQLSFFSNVAVNVPWIKSVTGL